MSLSRSQRSAPVSRTQRWRVLMAGVCALSLLGSMAVADAAPTTRVVGYLPEWTMNRHTWDLDLLSDVMVFSGAISSKGELTVSSGWSAALIDALHKKGVRAGLSVRCFDPAQIHTVLTPGAAQDALIADLVDRAIVRLPGDGVDLDFEGMNAADRTALVAFVRRLVAALRVQSARAQLSLAMPAVDWNRAYDIAALADTADFLFIMGYGYHYAGSSGAGPVAPLAPMSGTSRWGRYNLTATLTNYLSTVAPAQRGRIVLGLPLYGIDWEVDGPDVGAKVLSGGTSIFYDSARKGAMAAGRKWDADSSTPWYSYQRAGAWHQVWYDDGQSLGAKMDLALQGGAGGVGWWALGYEDASLWDAVRPRVSPPPPPIDPGPGPGPDPDPMMGMDGPGQSGSWPEASGCAVAPMRVHARSGSGWCVVALALIAGFLRRGRRERNSV